jgi:UPF0288 family protein (methanogenesis marker protein 3)
MSAKIHLRGVTRGSAFLAELFGPDAPQSAEALRRLGEVIDARVRGQEKTEAVSELQL